MLSPFLNLNGIGFRYDQTKTAPQVINRYPINIRIRIVDFFGFSVVVA
jgi:hypothetical protein